MYRYGIVGFEGLGLIIMIMAAYYLRKMIEIFSYSEFDLIRNKYKPNAIGSPDATT